MKPSPFFVHFGKTLFTICSRSTRLIRGSIRITVGEKWRQHLSPGCPAGGPGDVAFSLGGPSNLARHGGPCGLSPWPFGCGGRGRGILLGRSPIAVFIPCLKRCSDRRLQSGCIELAIPFASRPSSSRLREAACGPSPPGRIWPLRLPAFRGLEAVRMLWAPATNPKVMQK